MDAKLELMPKRRSVLILFTSLAIFTTFGFLLGYVVEPINGTLSRVSSVLVQAFTALLAFMGIFFIYRLSVLDSEIKDARDELNLLFPIEGRPDFDKGRFYFTPPVELMGRVTKCLIEKPQDDNSWFYGGNRNELIRRAQRLEVALSLKQITKILLMPPLGFMMALIFMSLFVLPFSEMLSTAFPGISLAVALFLVGFSIWVIWHLVVALIKIIE